jgi:raffinose/stachyose/melibiose transport system substrate-binding protein
MRQRIFVALLLFTLLFPLSLLANGTQEEEGAGADEPVTITWAPHWTNYIDTTLSDLAEAFEAENPNVTVELEAVQNYERAMRTRLAANELPDIVRDLNLDAEDYPRYYLPLNDLFDPDELLDYYKVTGPDGETVYAFPYLINYNGAVYNRTAFEEAGIESVPRTIDELWQVSDRLVNAGIVPVGTGFQDAWPLGNFYNRYPLNLAGDVELFNDLAESGDSPFENEAVIASLDVIRGLHERGYIEEDPMSAAWSSLSTQMAAGEKAMAMLATWFPPQIVMNGAEPEEIGMFPFPGSDVITVGGGASYGVAASAEHPEVAKRFLQFQIEEQRIAEALDGISTLASAESDYPWVQEITSFDVETLVRVPDSQLYRAITNEMRFNPGAFVQDYVLSDNPEEVLAEYTERWNNARESVQ